MSLNVFYTAYQKKLHIGTLTEHKDEVVFQYDESFNQHDIDILPNNLLYEKSALRPETKLLPPLFWDMLPTGYNAEILYKISNNSIYQIPILKKLAMCSKKAIGAIEFEPSMPMPLEENKIDLDQIEANVQNEENLGKLYRLLSSINGHTPKIAAHVSKNKTEIFENKVDDAFNEWIIKLPSTNAHPQDGLAEYVYSKMAKTAGIIVPEFNLFESKKCAGYFGSKRFDRDGKNKIHTLSAGALMNKYYLCDRIYIMDYIRVVKAIAPKDLKALLKLLIFNIKTGNEDMRGTNVSFILKDDKTWTLAPAYDLAPFSLDNNYTPKMLQNGYDKNEEDGKIYDLCEMAEFDLNEVASLIEETENAISQYYSLL